MRAKPSAAAAPARGTNTMIIGACTIVLHLPGVFSLKEKRSIVKSVLARLRSEWERERNHGHRNDDASLS